MVAMGLTSVTAVFLILGFLGVSNGYDLGVQYLYKYTTQVTSDDDCQRNEESHKKSVGFQIASSVHVTCIWENEQNQEEKLLKIELIQPSLLVPRKSTYQAHDSKLSSISLSPLYVEWVKGEIRNVFGDSTEDHVLKNLKKGIASQLQVATSPSPVVQRDVSGDCLTHYEVDGRSVKKKKNCFHPVANKQSHAVDIRTANVTSFSETSIELVARESYFVLSSESTDYVRMHSNMWKRPTVCVYSKSSLSLDSEKSGGTTVNAKSLNEAAEAAMTLHDGKFKIETLVADVVPKECGSSCKDLSKILSGYKEGLNAKNLAKLKSASSFLKLLELFRLAPQEEIIKVLKNKKYNSILPQLLDLVAFVRSKSSLHPAVDVINLFKKDSDLVERLLLSLSTSLHPDYALLQSILDLSKNELEAKIHATLVLSLGALTKTYTRNQEQRSNEKIVEDIESYLIEELNSCKLSECQILFLRGLRNAALPSSVPVLLEYAEKGGKPAFEALLALQNIGAQTPNCEKVLQGVFYQLKTQQTTSSRALAAELLLRSKLSIKTIDGIFRELRKSGNIEFRAFVWSKINKIMSTDVELRSAIKGYLIEEEMKHQSFSQEGSSTSFTKSLITATGVNATYSIEMEMLAGGSMKRSLFDVNIFTPESSLNVLSVGMYAEGLSSLGGGSEPTESDEEGTTAGLELTILGIPLRPYVLFTSSSELFSLVWNGAASEPTPALQGNFLLVDDTTAVALQNGFVVDLNLKGVLSADLSASIEVSIFYRVSHSVVNNAAALVIKGSASIDTSFINMQGGFSFMGESAIEFISDLQFADTPYKMCFQMNQPQFPFRYNMLGTSEIPGSKYSVKINKKRKLYVPAQSFALHRNNFVQCASIL